MFVCDAFHAMTSERPYRAAMTAAQAVEELRRCSGSQFDPVVVEAFATLMDEQTTAEDADNVTWLTPVARS